jgi:hypothetical protein
MDGNIAIRSFQSEFSNILCVIIILLYSSTSIKYVVIIPSIYHIHRHIKHFNQSKEVSIAQKNLWWLNVIDYLLILNSSEHTELKGVISGCISFYFIYQHYPITKVKKGFSNNILSDLTMIVIALIFIGTNDKYMRFFGIRELVYHLLEIKYYY